MLKLKKPRNISRSLTTITTQEDGFMNKGEIPVIHTSHPLRSQTIYGSLVETPSHIPWIIRKKYYFIFT